MAVSSQLSSGNFADMAVPSQLSSGNFADMAVPSQLSKLFKWRIIAVQTIIPMQQSPTAAQHISTAMETVKQTLKRLLTYLAEFRLLCEKLFCQFIKSLISV